MAVDLDTSVQCCRQGLLLVTRSSPQGPQMPASRRHLKSRMRAVVSQQHLEEPPKFQHYGNPTLTLHLWPLTITSKPSTQSPKWDFLQWGSFLGRVHHEDYNILGSISGLPYMWKPINPKLSDYAPEEGPEITPCAILDPCNWKQRVRASGLRLQLHEGILKANVCNWK